MKKDYLADQKHKVGITKQGMVVLFIFIGLFLTVIFRVAVRSGTSSLFSSMPSGNDAFEIAKYYIKPTIKTADVDFADENFEYAKRSDSVYEIKSYFETTSNFKKVKTNYDIVLKYNGGTSLNERNWKVVNLTQK